MKIQLVMLPQPILISDAPIQNGDFGLFKDGGAYKITKHPLKEANQKIIAGTPELPALANELSEKEQQATGWFDSEKLAKAFLDEQRRKILASNPEPFEYPKSLTEAWQKVAIPIFVEGFKTHQGLSENKFTLDDIRAAMEYGRLKMKYHTEDGHRQFIEQLCQPKIFAVEIEMEYRDGYGNWYLYNPDVMFFQNPTLRPRIVNNTIKVVKLI